MKLVNRTNFLINQVFVLLVEKNCSIFYLFYLNHDEASHCEVGLKYIDQMTSHKSWKQTFGRKHRDICISLWSKIFEIYFLENISVKIIFWIHFIWISIQRWILFTVQTNETRSAKKFIWKLTSRSSGGTWRKVNKRTSKWIKLWD